MKNEMSELFFGLEKLIDIFGDHGFVGEQKSSGEQGLLAALEKQIMALLLEVDNSISHAEELDIKLLGSQKIIDELSSKIKVLEDSLQSRAAKPEIVQERSIFEAPPPAVSEISEIEDAVNTLYVMFSMTDFHYHLAAEVLIYVLLPNKTFNFMGLLTVDSR
jgi:hypothetical protein